MPSPAENKAQTSPARNKAEIPTGSPTGSVKMDEPSGRQNPNPVVPNLFASPAAPQPTPDLLYPFAAEMISPTSPYVTYGSFAAGHAPTGSFFAATSPFAAGPAPLGTHSQAASPYDTPGQTTSPYNPFAQTGSAYAPPQALPPPASVASSPDTFTCAASPPLGTPCPKGTKDRPEPTMAEAYVFFYVIKNIKGKLDVNWEGVAADAGFKSADVAKVRFGQIKRKLGVADGTVGPKVVKTRAGAGATGSPNASRVKKSPIKRGTKGRPAKADMMENPVAGDPAERMDGDVGVA